MSEMPFIISLPEVALEKIFSFLTFDEIAKNRTVCKKFNDSGSKMLSRGFLQVEKHHAVVYKRMKSMLPRRESERRTHPLARHCDILTAVDTRISMLNMTYMKYIECNACCFIPGKVLDEIERVLSLVESKSPPPRTHELLQELRDISSMAMEHFDEIILPHLKLNAERPLLSFASSCKSPRMLLVQQDVARNLRKVKKQNKLQKQQIGLLTQHIENLFKKLKNQNSRLRVHSMKIKEQEKKLHEQSLKIQEQDGSLAELKKHMDEWDQKYSDLSAELVRAREDIAQKAKSTPVESTSTSLMPPKLFKSNIKPRIAQILPRNRNVIFDLERKRKSGIASHIPNKMQRSTEEITNAINENITNNISKSIIHSSPGSNEGGKSRLGFLSYTGNAGAFISSSLESILKSPISSIKSRKRKIAEDIDLK